MINVPALYLLFGLTLLSFTGSWHCAVMCGPIAFGLSQKGNIFFYHAGRAVSYISSGLLAGYLGHVFFTFESLPAKLFGALFLSSFFVVSFFPGLATHKWGHVLFGRIAKHRPGLFIFGLASVFLPCGWLWTFLAAAAASGNALIGGLVTGILWLSSLPALAAIPQYFKKSTKDLSNQKALVVHRVLSFAGIYAVWSHFFLN